MFTPFARTSRFSYEETIAELIAAITSAGSTVFATIDQSAAAAGVGLSLRPTTLIVFGNPKGGTPLMDAFPLLALDLPLKALVWQERTVVHVAATPMAEAAGRYGIPADDVRLAAMDVALLGLLSGVAAP